MIKKLGVIFYIFILIIIFGMNTVFAYEDNLFKFDLPSSYKNLSYNNQFFYFADTKDDGKGLMIYAIVNSNMKKSVWDMDETDIRRITNVLGTSSTVSVDKKARLGKEKALKYILKKDESYVETYIMASNNYVYIVAFSGDTTQDLTSSDYMTIKNSFKLKDRTTNWNVVSILVIIVIVAIRMIIRNKKRGSGINTQMNYGNIDYNNMT